jgi:hypothetical protein
MLSVRPPVASTHPARGRVGLAFAALVAFAAPLAAATFLVDRFDDPSPIPQACTAAAGDCSLRGAIRRANELAGLDTVRLGPGQFNLTLQGPNENLSATGDLDLAGPVRLIGEGRDVTWIAASGLEDRVLDAPSAATGSTLEGLTLAYGQTDRGAGLRCAGGTIALRGVRIFANLASERGGGLEVLADCFLQAWGLDLGVNEGGDEGGGAWVEGVLEIFRGKVSSNSALLGGGIASRGGFVHLYGVQISSNQALSGGGVFAGRGTSSTGFLLLEDSTVAANQANTGAGVRLSQSGAQIRHVTFGNQLGGDHLSLVVSGTASFPGAAHVWNTIFAISCQLLSADATIVSHGGSVEVATATCSLDHIADQDIVAPSQADLLPFADYGGDTWTVALGDASVARNAAPGNCTYHDQRLARRGSAPCDTGAFEVDPGFLFADDFESGGPWFWSGVSD